VRGTRICAESQPRQRGEDLPFDPRVPKDQVIESDASRACWVGQGLVRELRLADALAREP
jgi:hypothetical protein